MPTDDASVDFGAAVAEVVRMIPPGHVMTYGDVAAALGSRASRAVGKVMAHEGADLPWWRVVRAGGHPPLHHEARALEHYRAEGTPARAGDDDLEARHASCALVTGNGRGRPVLTPRRAGRPQQSKRAPFGFAGSRHST
ncbi:MGMT family protein [Curtobacterium flaccumfaciens]|nr:MGMT family protein [Curtobacterium flaccumfaciens]